MEKQQRNLASGAEGKDRLSVLPEAILSHILSLMPVKHAVKTCVLAKRWERIWRMIPDVFLGTITRDSTQIVTNILNQNENVKIRQLTLSIDFLVKDADIDRWLRLVVNRNIEYLDMTLQTKFYILPEELLTCSTLTTLKLKFHNIEQTEKVGRASLTSLKSLTLSDIAQPPFNYLKEPAVWVSIADPLNILLNACPVLEHFCLKNVYFANEKPVLKSATVKSVELIHVDCKAITLEFPSLLDAFVDLETWNPKSQFLELADPLFKSFQQAKRLTFNWWVTEFFSVWSLDDPLYLPLSCTDLTIHSCLKSWNVAGVIFLLRNLPNLEVLNVEFGHNLRHFKHKVELNLAVIFGSDVDVSNLKKVHVSVYPGPDVVAFDFIKFLLEKAGKLEQLWIYYPASFSPEETLTGLMNCPRVSPAVSIKMKKMSAKELEFQKRRGHIK